MLLTSSPSPAKGTATSLPFLETADLDWRDNAPFDRRFDDIYAHPQEALAETRYVFIEGNGLPHAWRHRERYVIAETGFGTGLNFLATWQLWRDTASTTARLHFISVERYPLTLEQLQKTHQRWPDPALAPLSAALQRRYPPLSPGFHRLSFEGGRVTLLLLFDDVEAALPQLNAAVDAWYLDGFAPAKNPAMWSEAVFDQIARLTPPGGRVATFTAAGAVRRSLEVRGFWVERRPGFGAKREMLTAQAQGALASRAALPQWCGAPQPQPRERRAIVIGGGLAGTATAYALGQRRWRVTLIESHGGLATAASGNAAGVVMPVTAAERTPHQRWYGAGYLYSLALFKEFEETPNQSQSLAWRPCGVIQGAWNERERERQKSMRERQRPPCDLVEFLDPQEASDCCGLTVSWPALFYPQGGFINPPSLCEVQRQRTLRLRCLFGRSAQRLRRNGNEWEVWDDEGVIASAPIVVLATGAEDTELLSTLPTAPLPIRPMGGQISAFAASAASQHLKTVVCSSGYALPPHEGVHWIGATYDHKQFIIPTAAGHDANLRQLQEGFPALASLFRAPCAGRTGVRATTPDHLPLVGALSGGDLVAYAKAVKPGTAADDYPPLPLLPGLYVSLGHGSRGLVSAPLAGELLAALIDEEPLPVPAELAAALHPGRFYLRQLLRR